MSTQRGDAFVDELHAERAHELLECVLLTGHCLRLLLLSPIVTDYLKARLLGFLCFLVIVVHAEVLAHKIVGLLVFALLLDPAWCAERVELGEDLLVDQNICEVLDLRKGVTVRELILIALELDLVLLFRMRVLVSGLFLI